MREKNFYLGDTSRFHKLFHKAEQGEPISLLFLGASVTFSFKIPENDQFPVLIKQHFADTFQNDNISLFNLSSPGLPSIHALYQCYHEAPVCNPDLVILDYSINDQKNPASRTAYESLLIKALSLPASPAVMSFFIKGCGENGYTCAPHMSVTNEHYGVAYANVGAQLDEDIESGLLSWDDYSYDDKHPGPDGHHYLANQLIWFLKKVAAAPSVSCLLPGAPLFGDSLAHLTFLEKPWIGSGRNFPASVEITLTCHTLFLSYMVDTTPDMGQLSLEIDGTYAFTLDAYRVDEWDHPAYKVHQIGKQGTAHSGNNSYKKETHRIRLYTDSDGPTVFYLLALGYD